MFQGRHGMNQDALLSDLGETGALADIDRYFARLLTELGAAPATSLAGAVASAMHRSGHACLPLGTCAGRPIIEILEWSSAESGYAGGDLPDPIRQACLPAFADLKVALSGSPVVASGQALEAKRPLVLDGDNLYLHRMFAAESRLALRMRELARDTATPCVDVERWMREVLLEESEAAIAAAKIAVSRQLCVVTGGPGTGKTTLAASLIALLADLGIAAPRRIALAAPTGKAAARLQESVRAQFRTRALADKVPALRDFTPVASTLHRLLLRTDTLADALLVDECSMVDLSLMARLLDGLEEGKRLILLGDAGQLSSVEPGSVFSDLCATSGSGTSLLAPCIVRLTKSHRFGPSSGIGHLAGAIGRGDAASAIDVLKDSLDTNLEPLADEVAFGRFAHEAAEGWAAHFEDSHAGDAFPARRVLCAHRRGPFGVNRFNRLVERRLRDTGSIPANDEFYPGRPIIVTRNDRATGLSNGDTGIVILDSRNRRRVWFPDLAGQDGDDARFLVSPSRLPEHESFFALTVHRAQGSEYDEVVFIPGDADSRVNTRELLYTAVTRARNRVTVRADEDTVSAAIRRRTARATGLPGRLRDS
ncbi:MAG: exodeoxyribonuclease V subunit alpha [Gammaproteobacteria bacterium]|nr:exodeoxyribonuclease V subunit alpha [Gammaproteobacteria bacterium]